MNDEDIAFVTIEFHRTNGDIDKKTLWRKDETSEFWIDQRFRWQDDGESIKSIDYTLTARGVRT